MTEGELDDLYTQICHTMTTLGADKSELFLARLTLLLLHIVDDPQAIRSAISEAAQINS